MRNLWWVLPIAFFFLNPNLACGTDEPQFQYGAAEMQAAIAGTWSFTITPTGGTATEVTVQIDEADTAPGATAQAPRRSLFGRRTPVAAERSSRARVPASTSARCRCDHLRLRRSVADERPADGCLRPVAGTTSRSPAWSILTIGPPFGGAGDSRTVGRHLASKSRCVTASAVTATARTLYARTRPIRISASGHRRRRQGSANCPATDRDSVWAGMGTPAVRACRRPCSSSGTVRGGVRDAQPAGGGERAVAGAGGGADEAAGRAGAARSRTGPTCARWCSPARATRRSARAPI